MTAKELSEKVVREFKLTNLALRNKNTVYLLTIILIFFGIYSYRNLPKELFPEITWPQIMVQTIYFGNSPEDIENLITRPLEKEIENVRGMKEITSISAPDVSMIFVEFNTDVDLEDALRRVKDAVDIAESELPPVSNERQSALVFDIDLSEIPILNINLSGEYSVEELKGYAEYLQDELERIGEVSKVYIEGVNEREIKVNVDLVKMMAQNLTFYDISSAIRAENISISGGDILLGKTRRSIRTVGEFEDPKEMEDIIIKKEEDKVVYLKDVAEIVDDFAEPSTYARLDRNPVVSVQIVKKSGENLLEATKKIYNVLDEAKADNMLPEDLGIAITDDQSEMVKAQLLNLENTMIMGVILVITVLFFFLGTRNALFVGLAIPMSMMISFVVIGIIDYRINMMVLFGLILALGMLVDNAIVVVENIYRFVDNGYEPWEAARKAVGEIAVPIIASTATTLAAFFPIAMWQGIMGEFMKILPVTLIIVLTSSLFVALVIIPVVAATFIKINNGNGLSRRRGVRVATVMVAVGLLFLLAKWMVLGNLLIIFGLIGFLNLLILRKMESWFQKIFLQRLERAYEKTLRFALKGKRLILFFGGTIVLLIFTIVFYGARGTDVLLFPENDPNTVFVICELPIGTDITATNEYVKVLEDDIFDFMQPYTKVVESVLATVGRGDPNNFTEGPVAEKARITINFVDYEFRGDINTSEIMRKLSKHLIGKYPGVEIELLKDDMGPPTGKPINVEIIGAEFDQLVHLADTIKTFINLAGIEGMGGLKMDISTQKPELMVVLDRDKVRRLGLSTQDVAFTLRTALYGEQVSEFKVGEDEYPIQLRLKDEYRYDLAALQNLRIIYFSDNGPIQIPLSSVAEFKYTTSFSSVRRKDLDRVITLYSNVIEGYNPTRINEQIKARMESFKMPQGYRYAFTGEQEEQAESSEFLKNALLIAMALIMIILVTQFNSVIRTFIILISILFSTIGVFGGLATFRMDFIIIMTGIGIISLAGIVVNNAIVLVDYIELLKARKRKELGLEEGAFLPVDVATECIVLGGKTRLRPVLLTAITTILGLIPMAIGLNIHFEGLLTEYSPEIYFGGDMAKFWAPLSWTVIFGLTFSTFLTLVIVPVMYRMTTLAQKRWRHFLEYLRARKNNNNGLAAQTDK
ncbi:MAG: efflux RND transporter permease subunit [Bacteroidales bacterium]|nr:efflux RND transporter permease subunit [Bacteroidales bacterium]